MKSDVIGNDFLIKTLVYFDWKYQHDWDSIMKALILKEVVDSNELDKVYNELTQTQSFITAVSADYPEELKHVARPPFVIALAKN